MSYKKVGGYFSQTVGQMLQDPTARFWMGSGGGGGGAVTSITTTGTGGPATLTSGVLNIPQYAGGVTTVSNADSTLTISPTSGAVVASLNLAHANTWTGSQTISLSSAVDQLILNRPATNALAGIAFQWGGVEFGALRINPSTGEFRIGSTHNGGQSPTFYSNAVEAMRLSSAGNLLVGTTSDNGAKLQVAGTSTFSDLQTLENDSVGTGSNNMVYLKNATSATSTVNQYSPALAFEGQGWKTTATAQSQQVIFQQQLKTFNGTTNPVGDLVYQIQINGGSVYPIMYLGTDGVNTSLSLLPTSLGSGVISGYYLSNSNTGQLAYFTACNQSGVVVLGAVSGYHLRLQAQGVDRLVFAPTTGNCMIGSTTDGGQKFQVTGTSQFTGATTVTGAVSITGNLTLAAAGNALYITEGSNGRVGQVALVAGTIAVTITGLTTSSRAFVQLVTFNTGGSTIQYAAVCTSNTLTITAHIAAGTINTSDISTMNYFVIN